MSEFNWYMEPWNPAVHPANLPKFDNVKLTAVAACPTFGIMRYEHHKVYASGKRAMALEAGLAAHEAFAAVRLGDLYFNGPEFYGADNIGDFIISNAAVKRANQLFGAERCVSWMDQLKKGEDIERSIMLGALDIFETSGFYDDPDDKRRTIANIEETIIAYCTKYPIGKTMCVVAVDALARPFIGVEIPIDMYLRVEARGFIREYHFVGRCDGVMYSSPKRNKINVEDDKTASRLNDAWHESWKINHQPTGYCAAVSTLLAADVRTGNIRGASIPLPKSYDYGGVVEVPFTRNDLQFEEWIEYVMHIMSIVENYGPRPLTAPRYTHSCNRYFRPCHYIPFCDSPVMEREAMYNEMDNEIWDPITGAHYEEEDHEA